MDSVFSDGDGHMDNNFVADNSIPSASCTLCRRIFASSNEVTPDLETMGFCGDCNFLLLEDLGNFARNSHHSDRGRTRTRHSSSESIENRRWRNVLSDTDSEDFDQLELDYTETGSNATFGQYRFVPVDSDAVSFSDYGGESEASVVGQGFLDAGISTQPDYRSDFDMDTDIDPMQAGLNQWMWNSDDQEWEEEEEEDVEWEEAESEDDSTAPRVARAQLSNYLTCPSESGYSIPRNLSFDSHVLGRVIHPSFTGRRRVADMDFTHIVGNSGDYLDERGFEEFLEQLAETNDVRPRALPAVESFLNNMPTIIIDKERMKINNGLTCAICKDILTIGFEVNQLPCLHLYHPQCISSWLNVRNSCPLCRYELPTDSKDYEEKQNSIDGIGMPWTNNMESSEVSSDENGSEVETDGSVDMNPANNRVRSA